MSSAALPHQDISGTFANDGSIALAGHFPTLTNVAIGTRESNPPPKPSSTVPFRRDPHFIDRGDLLSKIDERCSQPAGRAVLVGLGGVGKSQLAIEHAYRTRERSPETWVFWVHASNAARFEQGYRDLADIFKIAGREDPKADIFKMVYDWLRGYDGKWLMILDNVDNADFLVKPRTTNQSQSSDSGRQTIGPLRDCLPQSQNGSFLITTRSRESASKLSEWNDLIQVDPMDASSAVELLNKKLETKGQSTDRAYVELVAALEFMPLAIVQAAAYIIHRESRCSVRRYLEIFRKSDRGKTRLLKHEGGEHRRDGEAKNSIIITWKISFEHIQCKRPSAADLLSLMSFFDRQGIPEFLIRDRASRNGPGSREERYSDEEQGNSDENDSNNDSDITSESDEDNGFEEDVQILRDYSFVSFETDRTFGMHALVQLATRKWLEASGQYEQWKCHYIHILASALPFATDQHWSTCQALFPHAKATIAQQPRNEASLREWASLLFTAASYALRKSSVTEALDMSRAALDVRKKVLGHEHEETLSSIRMVCQAYIECSQLEKAEELEMRVMETRIRVLGEEHSETLDSMAHLVFIYLRQRRWKEAEELQMRAIEISKKVLGEEHSDTLESMDRLANIYLSQERKIEAEELQMQVIEKMTEVLGDEHPNTLNAIDDMASIFCSQGRWTEAEELMVRVTTAMKKVLGEISPDTLMSMVGLATIYRIQGRWTEAEELELQVEQTSQKIIGEEHPLTPLCMNNFALILKSLNEKEKAIALMEEYVEKRKQVLGYSPLVTKRAEEILSSWRMGDFSDLHIEYLSGFAGGNS